MDTLLIVVMLVLFVAVLDKLDTKKPPARPLPPKKGSLPPVPGTRQPERPAKPASRLPFDIPPIQGAPGEPESAPQVPASPAPEARPQQRKVSTAQPAAASSTEPDSSKQPMEAGMEGMMPVVSKNRLAAPVLQAEALRQAVIYAEVLGAPKAKQNRRWHR